MRFDYYILIYYRSVVKFYGADLAEKLVKNRAVFIICALKFYNFSVIIIEKV